MGKFGAEWFGAGQSENQPASKLTRPPFNFIDTPRRYGFHATLKAPMRLANPSGYAEFRNAVRNISQQQSSINLGLLSLKQIGRFLALVADDQYHPAISDFAWTYTAQLDCFRAPLNETERSKRTNLSMAENANLEEWGYPYVGNSFRFHMTLTSALKTNDLTKATEMLEHTIPDEPTTIDSICIFGDPGPLKPFELVERFRLPD